MHGISDLRLPALTVGVVYRTGYGYAPAQPADRKKQDGQARRLMHFISVKRVTSNRKAAHVPTPAGLKEAQKGHDPVEGNAHWRVAIALGMDPRPGAKRFEHVANPRAASCLNPRASRKHASPRNNNAHGKH